MTHNKEFRNEVAKKAIADCEGLKDSLDELIYMCAAAYSNFMDAEMESEKEEAYFVRYKTMKQYIVENFGKR